MVADPSRNTVAPQSAPESNPMTFSARLLIRQLQELARLLRGARHRPCDVRALAAAVDHIKALVAGDGLGHRIDSVPELVLRAQGRLVLTALTALGELAADPAARHRLDTLVLTPFHQLEDWIAYVAHELNGSAQGWISYREDVASDPAPYRAALREARATLCRLAEQSKAAPFLRAAIRRTDWPALQEPCFQIMEALTIPIDVQFRVPLVMVSVPTRNPLVERSTSPAQQAMTASLEQRLTEARARLVDAHHQFITDVLLATRDAAIETLEKAFAKALPAPARLAGAPHDDAPATADTASQPTSDATEVAINPAHRVLARIREVPGSHIGELSQSLGMPASAVRRHVRELAAANVIRIEGTHARLGAQRTFFPRDQSSVSVEARSVSAEVHARLLEAWEATA